MVIDPDKLRWWRDSRGWSRQDLSNAVTRLALASHPDALPFTHRRRVSGGRWENYAPADGHQPVPTQGRSPRTCTVCGARVRGGLTPDAIAKMEKSGEHPDSRRPKGPSVRALCAALSTRARPVAPDDLRPGGEVPSLSLEERNREAHAQAKARYNQALQELADSLGRPDLYRNRRGRVYYRKELRDLYDLRPRPGLLAS
jgi:hypothetical protein